MQYLLWQLLLMFILMPFQLNWSGLYYLCAICREGCRKRKLPRQMPDEAPSFVPSYLDVKLNDRYEFSEELDLSTVMAKSGGGSSSLLP